MLCDKESFPTRQAAKDKLVHLNSGSGRHKITLYKCNLCGQFHLSTVTRKKMRSPKDFKYPIKVEEMRPGKNKKITGPGKQKPNPFQGHYATAKLLTKEQADALRRLVDNNKYLHP